MSDNPTIYSTFEVRRTYPKPPEKVFAALADPIKKRRWFAEGDHHDVEEFTTDFRVGGAELLRYRFKEGTPFKGMVINNRGSYLQIVPNERVVTASRMDFGDRCISASLVTFELVKAAAGTELVCTFQGAFFEGSDGPKIREMGWQKVLDNIGKALEKE